MDIKVLLDKLKDKYEFLDVTHYKKDDGCRHLEIFLTPGQVEKYMDFSEEIKNKIYSCELTYGARNKGDGILGTTSVEFNTPNILVIEGHSKVIELVIQDLFLTTDILFNKGL